MNPRRRRNNRHRRNNRKFAALIIDYIEIPSCCYGCAEGSDGSGHFACRTPCPPPGYELTGARTLDTAGWYEMARRITKRDWRERGNSLRANGYRPIGAAK